MIQALYKYRGLQNILIALLFAAFIAYSIVPLNFSLIAAFGVISVVLMVFVSNTAAIIFLFLITFTGEQFTGLGLIPQVFPDVLLTMLIVTLLMKAISQKVINGEKIELYGVFPVVGFLFVCLISAIHNGTSMLQTIIFIHSVFLFYLFFIALLNLDINGETIKGINKFLFFIFVIQIPTALFKWYFYGVYESSYSFGAEIVTGTFGRAPGAMSTVLPLFAIGFLLPMYVWTKKKLYLFLIFGFILFSFLGGKRAFPIILPLFLFYMLYFVRSKVNLFVLSKYFIISILIGAVALIGGLKLSPSMNPSGEIGGKFDPKFAIDKVHNYSTDTTQEGYTLGRIGSTKRVINVLLAEGIPSIFLGKGPGILIKSGLAKSTFDEGFLNTFGIVYGVTGLVWMLPQVGILGVICFLLLYYLFFKKALYIYRHEKTIYWQIFSIGTIGALSVIMFDFFAYSYTSIIGKVLPSVLYYVIFVIINLASHKTRMETNQSSSFTNQICPK